MVLHLFTDNTQKHHPLYMLPFLTQGLQSQVGPFLEWMDTGCLDRQLLQVGITTTTAEPLLGSTAHTSAEALVAPAWERSLKFKEAI